jgi:hypothetical protein
VSQDQRSNWEDRFAKKFGQKKAAQQEQRKNFSVYKDCVLIVFRSIEEKVAKVPDIKMTKNLIARTADYRRGVKGELETINVLRLRCQDSYIEFVPEGINFSNTKGRIRVRHNAKGLEPFLYLSLVLDPKSDASYPENLIWVLVRHDGRGQPPKTGTRFNEQLIESVLEKVFLEE